jgi:hypothetical protein
MFVARLRSEAAHDIFDFEDIGINWLPQGDPLVAVTDEGKVITANDVVAAALVLIWSVMAEHAEDPVERMEAVARLGLALAQYEPGDVT